MQKFSRYSMFFLWFLCLGEGDKTYRLMLPCLPWETRIRAKAHLV